MSNTKIRKVDQKEPKENHSIYLTTKEWEWLHKAGRGSPTNFIRQIIEEKNVKTENS